MARIAPFLPRRATPGARPPIVRRPQRPRCPRSIVAAVLLASCSAASAQAPELAPPPTRGRLLYETHCIACHNSQMHWRDARRVQDWASLRAQVSHWQARANLGWSDDDIAEVARHLNDAIYRLPRPGTPLALAAPTEMAAPTR